MSKIYLREKSLVNMIKTLLESRQLEETDLLDIFIGEFKKWLRETKGEEYVKKPISFLFQKHKDEFLNSKNISVDNLYGFWGDDARQMRSIGQAMIDKGLVKPYSLRSSQKFLERFKRPIEFFVQKLNLPDYAKLVFSEDDNYEVKCKLVVDFEKRLHDNENPIITTTKVERELKDFLTNFLGIDIGNPEHGDLDLHFDSKIESIGRDEWMKTDLKKIKSEMKKMPGGDSISRVVVKEGRHNGSIELNLVFKNRGFNYRRQIELVDNIKAHFLEKGYNPKFLNISRL